MRTPGFDRVAEEGILFRRAYTPNAKCAPSRAIILTGRNSWQLEQGGKSHDFFSRPSSAAGWSCFEANGYSTGYTGKGWGPGFANDASGKPRKITGQAWKKTES
ncbi:MAG: hypothetical protein CM1200mP29_12360 [Verrucomicrobiota bacterium]|nr:MAG: hypothetical protein CM1200mP29_12360 [Verrucomicrobiota bacterium]